MGIENRLRDVKLIPPRAVTSPEGVTLPSAV